MAIKWNDTIRDQLSQYIQNPAILMTAQEEPYEFQPNEGSINRLKRRRVCDDIALTLYSFLLENEISKNQLREFASGLFLNYCQTVSIYT